MQFIRNSKTRRWVKTIPKRMSSSAMILENTDGQALIVKANYKPYWTFPGGIVDPGETPKEAAIRETFEEVGIKIDAEKVKFVAVVDRKSDFAQTYQFIFKAPLEDATKITLQASEIDEYALITKKQMLTGDHVYGKIIDHWAHDRKGYLEQTFGKGKHA